MFILQMIARLKDCVDTLSKWQARFLAGTLGFVAAFALPPLYHIYLLIPAFSLLLWLVMAASSRWRAFVVGWWFGGGFFAAGLYWVSFALLVDAEKFAWLIPITITGFALGFGLYSGFATFLVRAFPGHNLVGKALVLAASWTFFEWVRGWFLTGFPWNPLGTIWAFSDAMIQGASVVGVFGLSLLAVLLAVLPGTVPDIWEHRSRLPVWANALGVVLLVGLWWGGANRLTNGITDSVPNVRLRLVQPNIKQSEKWNPALRERHMFNQLRLSTAPPQKGEQPPTHVIWSETSAPFFIGSHKPWLDLVGQAVPKEGLIILGAPHMATPRGGSSETLKVTNSLLSIDDQGKITAQYDKFHLVPFGEYMPLKEWLPLDRITQGAGSFLAGPGLVTLDLKGLPPMTPLICYEIIFPGEVIDSKGQPKWILNITNDAWYGRSAGPYQHFVNTQLRATEQGVPVVRVAGSGMSGIFDSYGRVQGQLALGEKGFLDGPLPMALEKPTIFAQYGNKIILILVLLTSVLGILLNIIHVNRSKN